MSKKFSVSEIFSSIQCEGPTIGTPSIFIRLGGCNLGCSFCDSDYAWAFSREKADRHRDKMLFSEMNELTVMDSKEIMAKVDDLNFGNAVENVVITGGEPLIWNIKDLIFDLYDSDYKIEIETNGTILPEEDWRELVSQWGVSPKLGNSGVSESLREREEVYRWFVYQDNTVFKFVLSVSDDLQEVLCLQQKYGIPSNMIWLMPESRSEQELKDKSDWIIEMCKQYGFNFCPRLQIMLWGNKRGV